MAKHVRKPKQAESLTKPLSKADISYLRISADSFKHEKGGLMPEEYPEHEAMERRIRTAIARAVEARERLQVIRQAVFDRSLSAAAIVDRLRVYLEDYK